MAAAADLAQIPDVDIDSDGVFKYVLIRVHAVSPPGTPAGESKEIVRGYKWAEYHGEGGAEAGRGLRGLWAGLGGRRGGVVGRGDPISGSPPGLAERSRGPGGKGLPWARPLPPSPSAPAQAQPLFTFIPSQRVSCPGEGAAQSGASDPLSLQGEPGLLTEPPSPSQPTSTTRCQARCRRRASTASAWGAGASPTRARTRRSTCTATPW